MFSMLQLHQGMLQSIPLLLSCPAATACARPCHVTRTSKSQVRPQANQSTIFQNNVKCVPSSPAPPRKRRHPIKEVLRRLAAVEARLDLCKCQDHAVTGCEPPLQKQSQAQRHRPRCSSPWRPDIHGGKSSNNNNNDDNNNNNNDCSNHNNAVKTEMLPPLVATLASQNPAIINVLDYKLPKINQGFQASSCHTN